MTEPQIDPLDVLRVRNYRLAPRSEFRSQLMATLRNAIDSNADLPEENGVHQMTLTETTEVPQRPKERRPRSIVLMVAAAVAVLALGAVVLTLGRDEDTPAVSHTSPTVPFDDRRDGEIAKAMLLDPAELAPGWTSTPFKEVVLDRSLAETVPGCAPFLDSAFESSQRAAVTTYRSFNWYPPPAVTSQYVVLFPSEAAAQAMFDATVDPRFGEDCLVPYSEQAATLSGSCCDASGILAPALAGEPVESDAEAVGADDLQVRVVDDAFWTDDDGVVHGPERFREVTLRVGRAIIIMDAFMETAPGDTVVSPEQFDTAIANTVRRARAALGQL